ncbi:hypothetical protein ELS19_07805 [Halogeometricum borinquense]|uniref:Uncharacterized protein n=1 Tax=Halogeometricum borinquense TaxID=60847 RepID=A0A482TPL9_9EURY|nr:hypothetical protein [Halogeometricum borinquense]RYJ13879.1 hypothetical protein ELS19_07805 [Halogeometricum borinquense]
MTIVPAYTFERWLHRLDGATFSAFVADLYASRGREVTVRDDGAVVLVDEGRVLVPIASRWRLRRPRVPNDADAIVAPAPSRRLRRVAVRRGLRLLGPTDIRNLALYGIDRRDAERLFEEYFGESPAVAAPESSDSSSSPLRRFDDVSLATIAAVVLIGLVVAAVFGPFGPGVAPAEDDAAQAGSNPVAVGMSDTADDGDEEQLFPPGIGPTGVTDSEMLAAAHADAVAGRSYRLVIRQSGTRDWNGRRWQDAWHQAEVENARHFGYTVTGYAQSTDSTPTAPTPTTSPDGADLVQYSAYADGEIVYVKTELRNNESFYRTPVSVNEYGYGVFERRASFAIQQYLTTTRTNVTRADRAQYPFRIVATGTPEHISNADRISDYRAEASVGSDGFVSVLNVSYDVTIENETREVSYRLEYAAIDEVNLSRPVWYDRAVNATVPPSLSDEPTRESNETTTETTATTTRITDSTATRITDSTATASAGNTGRKPRPSGRYQNAKRSGCPPDVVWRRG